MFRIEKLYKSYSNHKVLEGASLRLDKGTIQTIIGPNGSGKSTLVHIIAGLVSYKKGDLFFNDQQIGKKGLIDQADIGFVLEEPLVINRFSIREFLAFTAFLHHMDKEVSSQRITDLCLLLNLPQDKMIEDLSKGQKMKVAISAALIHNPSCIIMDEPFNGVDFKSTRIIGQLLKRKARAGVSILITSHQYDIILELSDNIAVLKNGKVEQNLSKQDFFEELDVEYELNHTIKDKMIHLMGYEEEFEIPDWM